MLLIVIAKLISVRYMLKFILHLKWRILDSQDQQIAEAAESGKDIVEHAIGISRTFAVTSSAGATLATFNQTYTSITLNFNMDFSQDSQHLLDLLLGLALGIVVAYKALTENNRDRSRNLGGIGGFGELGGFGGGIKL